MAENNWVIQDGRSILVEFSAAPTESSWDWFGMRGSGEGMQFATAPTEWTLSAWDNAVEYILAAETYVPPPAGSLFNRMLMGIGV